MRPLRRSARLLSALALAVPAVVGLGAAPAAAAPGENAPVTFDYSDCPDQLPVGANPANWQCAIIVLGSGTMKLGSMTQEITEPITITVQSGYDPAVGDPINNFVSMKSKAMTVPGGALGIPGSEGIPLLDLKVKTKYVGNFRLFTTEQGQYASTMDMRIKLKNDLLGDDCYIGSKKAPVSLNLVGDNDSVEWFDNAIAMKMNDTTFSVPASSCGWLGWLVDFRSGLPSASGGNAANFQMYLASKSYTELFPAMRTQARATEAPKLSDQVARLFQARK
ncbi:hypothetical protein SAMN05443665_102857 [Actinomadura meyerae]|jgi:hypothetical protein|uniref:Uncharacterized protein n=1 Tax=Actinomadura meyerae TaxID=240840 RepID=A0A239MGV7_9ACTN|nr:hypothetical protein [Actinomadura meyerae]SNT41901.1 hypothetical protein SAMN05443665_102857 [Actinomadura meyerae]